MLGRLAALAKKKQMEDNMETWLSFITGILNTIAWPFVALLFLILFRKPFSDLIENINLLKYKDLEISISNRMENAKNKLPYVMPINKESTHYQQVSIEKRMDYSDKIDNAWIEFEKEMKAQVSEIPAIDINKEKDALSISKELFDKGIINGSTCSVITTLSGIRSDIIENPRIILSASQVTEYENTLESLSEKMFPMKIVKK